MKRTAVALACAALVALSASPAFAQYPQPNGSVELTPSDATPAVGQTVTVNVVVSDAEARSLVEPAGDILASYPAGPVDSAEVLFAPYACNASVSGGAGATVTPASFTTADDGSASLSVYTGTQPGVLTVGVDCGTASGQVLLTVGDDDDDDGDGSPTAPAGATSTPGAPSTGTGSSGGSGTDTVVLLGAATLIVLVAGGGALVAVRSRKEGLG